VIRMCTSPPGFRDASALPQCVNLTCEHLSDPVGVDTSEPRLSWMATPHRLADGWSFELAAAYARQSLERDLHDVWHARGIAPTEAVLFPWRGPVLRGLDAVWWRVRAVTADGKPGPWSAPALLVIGLDRMHLANPVWIGHPTAAASDPAARLFRRTFNMPSTPRRAFMAISAGGFFDAGCNGVPLNPDEHAPAFTTPQRRMLYRLFDVSSLLRQGSNTLSATVVGGRYQMYGGNPCLWCEIHAELQDGTIYILDGADGWMVSVDGRIRESHEYHGEVVDLRRNDLTAEPDRGGLGWTAAGSVAGPLGRLEPQPNEPLRVRELLPASDIAQQSDGGCIVDFGRAFYGTVAIRGKAPPGTEVTLTGAYSLRADGSLKTEDNREARCTDRLIAGSGDFAWSARFRGQGMRRVRIAGLPGSLDPEDIHGVSMHDDLRQTGSFRCSDPLVERIHGNILRGQRMFKRHGVPLDPDRDERQGWLGDPARDAESDGYNLDVAAFYRKWMGDIRLDQHPDGRLPMTSPAAWELYHRDIVWPSVITILPDWLHSFYGDQRILSENYHSMAAWMSFVTRELELPDGTIEVNEFGDWCDASTTGIGDWSSEAIRGSTCRPLISTAYHVHNLRLMARTARTLGDHQAAARFSVQAERSCAAFNRRFLDAASGTYTGDTQCAYALAFAMDLIPATARPQVRERFADAIERHQRHPSVGLVGMQWLFQGLDRAELNHLAWSMLTCTTRPSWGYMASRDATTIWERWDSDTIGPGMNSEALLILSGNLDAWLYQVVAGIRQSESSTAFREPVLSPRPQRGLAWAEAWHDARSGRISSAWRIDCGLFEWDFTLPCNGTIRLAQPHVCCLLDGAEVRLDEHGELALPHGTYRLVAPARGLLPA
jgi:alpha-L-rhamnosidase